MKELIAISLLTPLAAYSNAHPPSFSGIWLCTGQVEDVIGGKELILKQAGNLATGIWNGGISTSSEGSEKLRGYVKGNKLFSNYCSGEGNNWYKSCPEYGNNGSYFVKKNSKITEYDIEDNKLYRKGNEFILTE